MILFKHLALFLALAAVSQTKHASEVQRFSEENAAIFDHSVSLPPSVVDALLQSPEIRDANDRNGLPLTREQKLALLRAIPIHLGSASETDYLVRGSGELTGADNDSYWVVILPQGRPTVFFANGLAVSLLTERENDYRVVQTDWCSAAGCVTNLYGFRDGSYRLQRQKKWVPK